MLLLDQYPDNILTVREAAQILKIPISEVCDLLASGQIKHFAIGCHIRIPKIFLEDFLETRCQVLYNTALPLTSFLPLRGHRTLTTA